jgi:hypothetical protein
MLEVHGYPLADATIDSAISLILHHEAIDRTCLRKRISRLLQQTLVNFMPGVQIKEKLIIESRIHISPKKRLDERGMRVWCWILTGSRRKWVQVGASGYVESL